MALRRFLVGVVRDEGGRLVTYAGELDAFTAGLVPPVVSLQGVSDVRLDLEKPHVLRQPGPEGSL